MEQWQTPAVDNLCRALAGLESPAEAAALLRDLCTLSEIEALSHRLAAAKLLARGRPYAEVAQQVGASTTTVTRVAHWLHHGEGGYAIALERLGTTAPVR
jgi:TrpR-related protein YerC/YecD